MLANTNIETGIRFGVSSGADLPGWIWDEAVPMYPERDDDDDDDDDIGDSIGCVIDTEDLKASTGDDGIWMIFFSTNIVRARLCSPCFPNAGDVGSIDPDGFECYGWPEDEGE